MCYYRIRDNLITTLQVVVVVVVVCVYEAKGCVAEVLRQGAECSPCRRGKRPHRIYVCIIPSVYNMFVCLQRIMRHSCFKVTTSLAFPTGGGMSFNYAW